MRLPPGVTDWGADLAALPLELAVALGPLLSRITDLVGPFPNFRDTRLGEPEGYEGLERNGSYERLLLSEWLFAEEIPDEFLRRAASREHAFFRLQMRERAAMRNSLVWFDAGPFQLGAPRLAHLAALVVFFRRARKSGVDFFWSALQQPETLHSGVTPGDLQALLNMRSAAPASEGLLNTWRNCLGAVGADDNIWLVGPPELADYARRSGFSLLSVSESAHEPALQLAAHRAGETVARRIQLALPDETIQLRLLRDPWRVRSVRRQTAALPSPPALEPPVFDRTGRYLFFRLYDQSVCYLDLRKLRPPRPLPGGFPTLAIGMWGKHTVRAILHEDDLVVEVYRGYALDRSLLVGKAAALPLAATGPLQPLYCWPAADQLIFFNGAGCAFSAEFNLQHIDNLIVQFQALAVVPFKSGLFWLERIGGVLKGNVRFATRHASPVRQVENLPALAEDAPFGVMRSRAGQIFFYFKREQDWKVLQFNPHVDSSAKLFLRPDVNAAFFPEGEIVGLLMLHGSLQLIELDAPRTTLSLVDNQDRRTVLHMEETPIHSLRANPDGVVALITTDGWVKALKLNGEKVTFLFEAHAQ